MGKSSAHCLRFILAEKHPHGRGEEAIIIALDDVPRETPPRAWGRAAPKIPLQADFRNTPTGVGKRVTHFRNLRASGKHPHGRGEEDVRYSMIVSPGETPPRAWGRVRIKVTYKAIAGNTPTGVGKSSSTSATPFNRKKHPHGRGEERSIRMNGIFPSETPPRAWGREHTQISNNLSIIAYFFHLSKSQVRSVLIFL